MQTRLMAIKTDELSFQLDTHQTIPIFIAIVPSRRLHQTFSVNPETITDTYSKMTRQFAVLVLAICFIMGGVFSAPSAQLASDGLSFMTPNEFNKATRDLENRYKIRRLVRSLSNIWANINKKTTPAPI